MICVCVCVQYANFVTNTTVVSDVMYGASMRETASNNNIRVEQNM